MDLLALVAALNLHDPLTRGHSERVRALSDLLAQQLDLDGADREQLHWAALLHDIGKLAVPAEILNKAGKPTAEEWAILKTHPAEGLELVEGPIADWLGRLGAARSVSTTSSSTAPATRTGLAGHRHLLGGPAGRRRRCVRRDHRRAVVQEADDSQEARLEITRCAGTHFDPVMVRAFLQISIGRLRKATGGMSWVAQLAMLGRALPSAPAAAGAAALTAGVAAGVIPTPLAFAQEPHRDPVVEVGTTPATVGPDTGLVPDGGSTSRSPGGAEADVGESPDGVPNGTVPEVDVTPQTTDGTASGDTPTVTTVGEPSTAGSPATTVSTPGSATPGSPKPPATTPGAPATTTPPTPGVVIPPITIPGTQITVPGISVQLPLPLPPVVITVPTLPITVPVTIPLSIPPVTIPPPLTIPPLTIPPLTIPPLTIPNILNL